MNLKEYAVYRIEDYEKYHIFEVTQISKNGYSRASQSIYQHDYITSESKEERYLKVKVQNNTIDFRIDLAKLYPHVCSQCIEKIYAS